MAALMTSVLGNLTKLAEYITECGRFGIKVLPPDINESRTYFHPNNGNIVFGLLALKNVGKQFVENIIRERTGAPFADFEDFVQRMSDYDINKRMVEGLIKAGAFDKLGTYRSRLLLSYERLIDIRTEKNRSNISGQLDMFSSAFSSGNAEIAPKFEYPNVPDFSLKEKLMLEKESSGMYFSGHMIDSYSAHIENLNVTEIAELLDAEAVKEKQAVKLCGIISSLTLKTTKNNQKMAFITVEDRYGEIECLVFPKIYTQFYQYIRVDSPVYIEGSVSLREDEFPKVLVNVIDELIDNAKYKPSTDTKPDKTGVVTTVDAHPTKAYTKIYLRVPDFNCREYLKVKNLVDIFEGNVKVIFYNSESSTYVNYQGGITATEYILSELREILGKENVVLK